MKKQTNNMLQEVRKTLHGKTVPVLVLDNRWHKLFPPGKKPADIEDLEDELNRLLKRQGYLVNDMKELKMTKRKLMDGIVAGMQGETAFDEKKKNKQQQLLLEIKKRIEEESDELLLIPGKIKEVNEELLILGAKYSFEKLEKHEERIARLEQEIRDFRNELNDRLEEKQELEEGMDAAYSLMHSILGRSVMNLFDRTHKRK